jgi:hypothetical protein
VATSSSLQSSQQNFQEVYKLGQYITFDERTIPIRNRACAVRVYNPKKPHKFGVEDFAAKDAVSFYCWHHHIYDKRKGPDLHDKMVGLLASTLSKEKHIIILDRGCTRPVVLRTL